MKVALLTANVGGIDNVPPVPEQSVPYDYFCYTEKNLPFPLHNLDSRLKGKYCKINTHRFLKHDIFIWIDGRIEITSPDFVKTMVEWLQNKDVVISRHQYRHNVYEEIHWIQEMMRNGNKYLLERYAHEPFNEELKFYSGQGMPVDYPLFACGVFARWNNPKVNWVFRDWWLMCLEYSNFDQSQFSYIAWGNQLNIKQLSPDEILQYIKIGKHK